MTYLFQSNHPSSPGKRGGFERDRDVLEEKWGCSCAEIMADETKAMESVSIHMG